MRHFLVAVFFIIHVLLQLFSGSLVLDGKWVRHERLHETIEPPIFWKSSDPFHDLLPDWEIFPKMFYVDEYNTFSNDFYDALQIIRLPVSAARRVFSIPERSVVLRENPTETSSAYRRKDDSVNTPGLNQQDRHIRRTPFHEVGIPDIYKHANAATEKKVPLRHFDLPRRTATRLPTYGWKRFYIALDLYKNEDLISFLTGALVAFIEDEIAPFFDVQTSVVVSIFTNNPSNELSSLIEEFLLPHLRRAGVHFIFLALDGTCLGYTKRPKWMGRIEWMACVRNKALEPLYVWGMQLFSTELYENPLRCGVENKLEKGSGCVNMYLRGTRLDRVTMSLKNTGNMTSNFLHDDMDGDKMVVLFFNDIYFRPSDVTSLLESVQEPSIESRAYPDGVVHMGKSASDTIERGESDIKPFVEGTTFDMACGMDFYYSFYDSWVSRDRHGEPFLPHMPFTEDYETKNALRRISVAASTNGTSGRRLSVPVKCCWNGLAAIRGRLFIKPIRSDKRKVNSLRKEDFKETSDKNVEHKEKFLLWGEHGYHRAIDAPRQVYNIHWTTLLQRLANYRHAWANRMRREAKKFGLTFSNNMKRDIRSIRGEYTENSLKKLNRGMAHLANELKNPQHNYYRDDVPSLRFRHAQMPSFGGTVEGKYSVSDDVCYTSECLLFCQDVMHAAILDGRAPVILMNPNVRVAYESKDFDRVTGWLYNSPTIFAMASWLNTIIVVSRYIFGLPDMTFSDRISFPPTSSADDWTAKDTDRIMDVSYDSQHDLRMNVTKFTSMACFSPEGEDTVKVLVAPICRLISIIVCVFLCAWMINMVLHDMRRRRLPKSPSWRNDEEVRIQWLRLAAKLRWCILRAIVHPRGDMSFGCPRCVCFVFRRIFVFCGFTMPRDTETDSVLKDVV